MAKENKKFIFGVIQEGRLAGRAVWMQQLRTNTEKYIGYWTNERSTSKVDFVIQDKG